MKLARTNLSKLRRSDLFVENGPAQNAQLRRSGIFRLRAGVVPSLASHGSLRRSQTDAHNIARTRKPFLPLLGERAGVRAGFIQTNTAFSGHGKARSNPVKPSQTQSNPDFHKKLGTNGWACQPAPQNPNAHPFLNPERVVPQSAASQGQSRSVKVNQSKNNFLPARQTQSNLVKPSALDRWPSTQSLRMSDFGLLSDFGPRPSDLLLNTFPAASADRELLK